MGKGLCSGWVKKHSGAQPLCTAKQNRIISRSASAFLPPIHQRTGKAWNNCTLPRESKTKAANCVLESDATAKVGGREGSFCLQYKHIFFQNSYLDTLLSCLNVCDEFRCWDWEHWRHCKIVWWFCDAEHQAAASFLSLHCIESEMIKRALLKKNSKVIVRNAAGQATKTLPGIPGPHASASVWFLCSCRGENVTKSHRCLTTNWMCWWGSKGSLTLNRNQNRILRDSKG